MSATVLVFDSGVGGLTVARALRQTMAGETLVYAADSAAFPYGDWQEPALVERICRVMAALIDRVRPDIVVVACNTASTLALDALRKQFAVPFVGTVPAIKPAAAQTRSNVIGVLATPGTVKREYTHALIHTYAFHCKVFLHGATRLAALAEAKLKGDAVPLEAVRDEIQPVFRRRGGGRTDVVVLGCTHYPLLLDELQRVAPWPVEWIDPAPAIARQAHKVLAARNKEGVGNDNDHVVDGTVIFTGRRGMDGDILAAYAAHGFDTVDMVPVPV